MIEIEEKIRIIDKKLHFAEPNVEGPYNNQDRLVGEGSRRIGSEVMLNTDLFCLSRTHFDVVSKAVFDYGYTRAISTRIHILQLWSYLLP